MSTANVPAIRAARNRPSRARIRNNDAKDIHPTAVISARPRPIKYQIELIVKVASVIAAAAMPHSNPATRLTIAKQARAAVSRQAASQYTSPTLESPNRTWSAPATHRYSG